MYKIIIATTFRSFNNDKNDKMQRRFLKSILRQNYENYELVVTIFQEKNVQETLKPIFGEKVHFCKSNDMEHRYSLSEVFQNGVDYGISNGADIILWCTGDVILQRSFFQTIDEKYCVGVAGISHPNIIITENHDNKIKIVEPMPIKRGIDAVFFDLNLFKGDAYRLIKRYRFYNWGIFEHFLAGIALKYAANRINIYAKAKVYKMENDRVASNDSSEFFANSRKLNYPVLRKFISYENVDNRIFDLAFLHMQYHMPDLSMREKKRFCRQYLLWYKEILKKHYKSKYAFR